MVDFLQIHANGLTPVVRKQMRLLWKADPMRRLLDLEEVYRWLILGEIQVWLAWDDDPEPPRRVWMDRHHCRGIVVTCLSPARLLTVHFAAGRSLTKWIPQAIAGLETFAAENHCVETYIFVRKGWLQELPALWKTDDSISLFRDSESIRVCPAIALTA